MRTCLSGISALICCTLTILCASCEPTQGTVNPALASPPTSTKSLPAIRGRTAPRAAIEGGNAEKERSLPASGASPNAVDANKAAPLHKAAKSSQKDESDEVPVFDELGRPVNQAAEDMRSGRSRRQDGSKPIRVVLSGPKEAKAFDETLKGEREGRPSPYLTRAVLMDMSLGELAKRIARGAGVNVKDPVFGYPLSCALDQQRSLEMVAFLLNNGANPNLDEALLRTLRDSSMDRLRLLLQAGADPMTADRENTPALALGARGGQIQVVSALIDAGAKIDAADKDGRSALYHALNKRHYALAMLLLDRGAPVKTFPALLALPWEDKAIPVAIRLLELGASATVATPGKETIAHWAVRAESPDLLSAAIRAGAPVNKGDKNGVMPLFPAVIAGRTELVTMLLKAGAPVNSATGEKTTFCLAR